MVIAAYLKLSSRKQAPCRVLLGGLLGSALLTTIAASAWSQIAPPGSAASRSVPLPTSTPVVASVLRWAELTKAQQEALQPLTKSWNDLSVVHRRKWIALAQNYPLMSSESKEKLHSRMVEWAALTPAERQVARLNFAETKKLAPTDRAADWEAYQALSSQERQKLAEQATRKTPGAAIAIKPNAPDKLATVPVTRHTPEDVRKEATSKQGVNQNTLLPKASRPASVASEPEPEAESNPAPSN